MSDQQHAQDQAIADGWCFYCGQPAKVKKLTGGVCVSCRATGLPQPTPPERITAGLLRLLYAQRAMEQQRVPLALPGPRL